MRSIFSTVVPASLVILALLVVALFWGADQRQPIGSSGPLRLYCAAGIQKPVKVIIDQYKDLYGIQIETEFQGSGALLSSIRANSGKGDLYLAADVSYMDDARNYGLIDEVAPIASQRPCIAVAAANTTINSVHDLLNEGVKLSIADPKAAAISRVAKKMLSDVSVDGNPIFDALIEKQTVSRSTVNEVANDIKSNSVDAGIVRDATANQYDELKVVRVPEFEKSSKEISISVLSKSSQPTRALHFIRFLTSRDKGLKVFEEKGYEIVAGDKWAETPELTLFSGGLMRTAIQVSIDEFEKREGVRVNLIPNGCGILVAQIRGGQHPDAYFACDTSFMTMVQDVFPTYESLSGTEMVLITPAKRQVDVTKLTDLTRSDLKIGLCDPSHSALGELTRILLTDLAIWEEVSQSVVNWQSTADHLVDAVVIGSLDAAVVYRANTTLQKDKLNVYDLDYEQAQAVQPIGQANDSDYPLLTARLIRKLRSSHSRGRFEELGFQWLGEGTTEAVVRD